ncbi:hypothetical protein [Paraherbaspirillum soli]|uniref:Lipoprotein n=1 Tax=Paraherbaspirillum soli TaxID=631222 RepID=A0ABW0M9D5_9BURK
MSARPILGLALALTFALAGCKPAGPPPDILKTQRQALDKAKAVDGQVQKQAQEQMKTIDDEQK